MSIKSLPSSPNLEHLKYQAKDLLNGVRARASEALSRVRLSHPEFSRENRDLDPGAFSLSDAQWVVAREYGFGSWAQLKQHVETSANRNESGPDPIAKEKTEMGDGGHASRVAQFLEYACPDHHVRGGIAHRIARNAAGRLLRLDPAIARENLFTACVSGELGRVREILAERPQAASEPYSAPGPDRSGSGSSEDVFAELGPKLWEPLLYLCFARVPIAAASENAEAIARELLERGANPNAFFMAGSSRYTPLVGVIGEGEENRLAHPESHALTRLLLEHGAEPFDIQVIYNLHFTGDLLWYLQMIHEVSVRNGRKAAWDDPDWSMLGMGGYGNGARFLLTIAIQRNDLRLAQWILEHGANPNAAPPKAKRLPQCSLHEYALQRGNIEMAALLARFGAAVANERIEVVDRFKSACFRLDRAEAEKLVRARPQYLQEPGPLMEAARMNRADVVELLLDLGMSPNIPDPAEENQRALHVAGYSDAPHVIDLLIRRGAEVDYRESNYGATALDFAIYGERRRSIEALEKHSADVWTLTFLGKVERLRELLAREPELARTSTGDGDTPLMRLPDDEAAAAEIVRLFLANGADPSIRNKQGKTAGDIARKRGLDEAAQLLDPGRL